MDVLSPELSNLEQFPSEVNHQLMVYLSSADIGRVSETSKKLKSDSDGVWSKIKFRPNENKLRFNNFHQMTRIGKFTTITYLDMSNMRILTIGHFVDLFIAIDNSTFPKLETLDLSRNDLARLPNLLLHLQKAMLRLKKMDLTQTRLKDGSDFKAPTANELVKYSTNLTNLQELGLSDNLMEVPMSVLVQAIPKLTILKLQYIFFSDEFKMTKNVLEEVLKAVTKSKCLKNLYIIGDDDESSAGVSPKLFAAAVLGLTNVYLGGIGFTAPQVTEILQASLISKTLKKLTLQFSDHS